MRSRAGGDGDFEFFTIFYKSEIIYLHLLRILRKEKTVRRREGVKIIREQLNKCNWRRLTNMKFLTVLKRELRGIIIALKYN